MSWQMRPVHPVGDSAGAGLAPAALQSSRRAAAGGPTHVAPWLDLPIHGDPTRTTVEAIAASLPAVDVEAGAPDRDDGQARP